MNKKKLTLGSNTFYQLYASAAPAVYDNIRWSTSEGAKTTINPVTGMIRTGTVSETVTVTASMDKKTAECIITVAPVTEADLTLDSTRYDKLTRSGAIGLAVGKSVLLKGVLTKGVTYADKKLIWASSDTTVAVVKNGRVKAKSAGAGTTKSAVITVYAFDNPEIKKSVTITTFIPVKSLKLGVSRMTLQSGGSGSLNSVTVTPDEVTDKKLDWSVESLTKDKRAEQILTIAPGASASYSTSISGLDPSSGAVLNLKASGAGMVRLTAKSTDGSNKKASVIITVK